MGVYIGNVPTAENKESFHQVFCPALLVAKRQITRRWKSRVGPGVQMCRRELLKWTIAEATTLHRELVRGLHALEIPQAWDTLLVALETEIEAFTQEHNTGTQPGEARDRRAID